MKDVPLPEGLDTAQRKKPRLADRLSSWLGHGRKPRPGPEAGDAAAPLSAREEEQLRGSLRLCLQARQTDSVAAGATAQFMQRYQESGAAQRTELLRVLALECGEQAGAAGAATLSGALAGTRVRFFKRFNTLPGGLPFLVGLRADMLRQRKEIPQIAPLEEDLGGLFSTWFDVGFLELRPITWDSPASLLEKLMRYEAVHEISSWADLRNRVDSDRRCYAFFHSRWPNEPLIFVEVAFLPEMAGNVQALLDENAPLEDLSKARWAIFYSISNTQPGLRGVSFGNFLLKRVIEELRREFPKLSSFATLSPIPGLNDWLRKLDGAQAQEYIGASIAKKLRKLDADFSLPSGVALPSWLQEREAAEDAGGADAAARPGHKAADAQALRRDAAMRLAAHYLARETHKDMPLDPVARFHLGNGARIERLNWQADMSKKGLRQSSGLMVNYLYDLDELDGNLRKLAEGQPAVGRAVAKLL
ncbi:malonyl-CoA decarboxylase domain-containing protein [Candidimonas nitroreducens]|nr:malonyl-CoA decarboxylase family protein [Candidimonas nitroreducens]